MKSEKLIAEVEIREGREGSRLHAVILTEGRAASGGRREVHAPGSATWPADGIVIRLGHGKPAEIRNVIPARATTGAVQVAARATDAIKRAVSAGAKYASIEFLPLKERTTKGGVREVLRSLVLGAALVSNPEFDTTSAEVRNKRRRRFWL